MGGGPLPPGVGVPGLGPAGMLGPGMPTQTSNMPLNIQNMFPPSFNTAQLLQQSKGFFPKPSHDFLIVFQIISTQNIFILFILIANLFVLYFISFQNKFQFIKTNYFIDFWP